MLQAKAGWKHGQSKKWPRAGLLEVGSWNCKQEGSTYGGAWPGLALLDPPIPQQFKRSQPNCYCEDGDKISYFAGDP